MTFDWPAIAAGFAAGCLLGALFFAGLWWTVRRALGSAKAALWFGASYLARVALLAGGLFLLAQHHPARGVAACAGVLVARLALALFRPAAAASGPAAGSAR